MTKISIKKNLVIQLLVCLLNNLTIKAQPNNDIQIDSSDENKNRNLEDVIEVDKETIKQLKYNIKEKIFSNNRHSVVYDLDKKKWIRIIEFTGVEVRDIKIDKDENSILKKDLWCYNAIREEWKKIDVFRYCYRCLIDPENYEQKSLSQNIAFVLRCGIGGFYGSNLQPKNRNPEKQGVPIVALGYNIPGTFSVDYSISNVLRLGLGVTFEFSKIFKILTKDAVTDPNAELVNSRLLPFVLFGYKLLTNLKYAITIDLNLGFPLLFDLSNDYHASEREWSTGKKIQKKVFIFVGPGVSFDYKLGSYLNFTSRLSYSLNAYRVFDDAGKTKETLLLEHGASWEAGVRFTFGNNKFKYL